MVKQSNGPIRGPCFNQTVMSLVNHDMFIHFVGWAALQHIAYLRGSFEIPHTGTYLISVTDVTHFKIDHRSYTGNVYGYHHSCSSAIHLEKGMHHFYVAFMYDIRMHGLSEQQKFTAQIQPVDRDIVLFDRDTLLPQTINGRLITAFASVTLMNTHATKWFKIVQVTAVDQEKDIPVHLATLYELQLAPGQVQSIPIEFEDKANISQVSFKLTLCDTTLDQTLELASPIYSLKDYPSFQTVFKLTFRGYDDSIQYGNCKSN
jgi:hypothetical protein